MTNQENLGFWAVFNSVTHYVQGMMKDDELRYLPFRKVFLKLPSDEHLLQQQYVDPDEPTLQNFLVDTKTEELRGVADSLLLLGKHDNNTGPAMISKAMYYHKGQYSDTNFKIKRWRYRHRPSKLHRRAR